MLKFMYFAFLVSFIISFVAFCSESFTCIHDKVTEPFMLKSHDRKRSIKYQDITANQNEYFKSYEPLKIYFYIENLDKLVSPSMIHNIEIALEKVQSYISNTFRVHKRKRPFVLKRHSCIRKWQSGPNEGKCSKLEEEQEFCVSQDITYPIPGRFLDGLEVYEFDRKIPEKKLPQGSGLKDSNFIVFVISESSELCEGSDVSSFGTYCRSDSITNEPLAGILNFCPGYFVRKMYPTSHYYNVILHEIFHILGFSIHLFEKFLPCSKGVHCDLPKNLIQSDSNGIPRLMLPLVVEKMQKHFSCPNSDFGAPMVLEVANSTEEEEDETKHITSHWDPLLMYSSIMTPKFSEYDQVIVDNITLSVFESTGWYQVNYTQADDFRFGKGQGCGFGINSTCSDNEFLCDPKAEDILGCDLLHKAIGKCTKLSPQRTCGVYQTFSADSCELNIIGKQYGLDFYGLGYRQGCFMVSEENSNTTATCLPLKCKTSTNYNILINMMWYECGSEQKMDMRNVSVHCPDSSLFCTDALIKQNIPRQYCPENDNFFIAVRMYFTHPSFDDLIKSHGFKKFKVTALTRIAEKLDIPVNYIVNASLSLFKNIQLDFIICPNVKKNDEQLSKMISNVQSFLDGSSFMQILVSDKIASSSDMNIDPRNAINFSDHEGFRTLLIFPALCVIFLVATLVASIMRFLKAKSYFRE